MIGWGGGGEAKGGRNMRECTLDIDQSFFKAQGQKRVILNYQRTRREAIRFADFQ